MVVSVKEKVEQDSIRYGLGLRALKVPAAATLTSSMVFGTMQTLEQETVKQTTILL